MTRPTLLHIALFTTQRLHPNWHTYGHGGVVDDKTHFTPLVDWIKVYASADESLPEKLLKSTKKKIVSSSEPARR
jgi:hypothetical protein